MRQIVFLIILCMASPTLTHKLNIHIIDSQKARKKSPNAVYFVPQDFDLNDLEKACEKCSYLSHVIAKRSFKGKAGSTLTIPMTHDEIIDDIMIVGLGGTHRTKPTLEIEDFRRAIGTMIQEAHKQGLKEITVHLPNPALFDCQVQDLAKELGVIAHMAQYAYEDFLNKPESHDLVINIATQEYPHKEVEQSLNEGRIIGKATNTTRFLVDAPANVCTPTFLALQAKKIAAKVELSCTIFDEEQVHDLGMGGLSAVSQGSMQECRFVILEYHYHNDAPTICLAGKGVTHDAGGLNVKLHVQELMKTDMGGAGAVIGAMEALGQLKPKINVIALLPMTENLLGANAYRPGDILRFYNGKTAEIINTDAEGRLILADALSYGVKVYQPDVIIDMATLTGANARAVGPFYMGLMSEDEWLVDRILKSSKRSGDRTWRLPLHQDYKPSIKSPIADMTNLGLSKYKSGATTAGIFLQQYVDDTPWAHFDIAGAAFNVPDISYFSPGATGAGVRILVDLLMHWS